MHTIEVEINGNGQVRSLDPLIRRPAGRALLTLLDRQAEESGVLAEAALAENLKP